MDDMSPSNFSGMNSWWEGRLRISQGDMASCSSSKVDVMVFVSSTILIGIAFPPLEEKVIHGRVLKGSKSNLSKFSKGGIISSRSTSLR